MTIDDNTRRILNQARDILDHATDDPKAPGLVKEIEALLDEGFVGPKPGDPFIDHLRFSAAAGEKMDPVPRLTVATYDTLDARFRTVTDDPTLKHTLDADLDEPAYSAFVNDAISKALHESLNEHGDLLGVFPTPEKVLRLLREHGVVKGTKIVDTVLAYDDFDPDNPSPFVKHRQEHNKTVREALFGPQCIVHGCTNRRGQGQFHEHVEICIPCWNMITSGNIGPSTNFIADLKIVANGFNIATENAQILRIERDRAVADLVTVRKSLATAVAERDAAREASAKARADINAAYAVADAHREASKGAVAEARIEARANCDTFRALLSEVYDLMMHQALSTTSYRKRIRDALDACAPYGVTKPVDTQPGYANVTSAAVALKKPEGT